MIKADENKVWSPDEIKDLIQTNDKVLYGALIYLYRYQTSDERIHKETRNNNGVGFNSVDAKFLSSVSEFFLKTGFLTYKQKQIVRKKLMKYVKQLTKIANHQL